MTVNRIRHNADVVLDQVETRNRVWNPDTLEWIAQSIAEPLGTVGIQGYRSSDATYQPARLDKSTNTLQTIEYEHHEIHAGSSFTVCDTLACNSTTVKWMIITPNSLVYAHLIFDMTCTGEATFLVTGDADRTAGTELTVVNRRRVGTPAVATVTVSRTPTGGNTDGATTLFSKRAGIVGVGGKNIEGSNARDTNEWILKPNTKYVVSITTYANDYATCKLDWYEHADIA